MLSLDVLEADRVFTLAQWGPHAVVVWHATPDVLRARKVANLMTTCATQAPGRACYFAWVLPTAGQPEAPAREVLTQMGRKLGSDIACMMIIVGDDGFFSAIVRAVITGMEFAARSRFPLKLAATLEEGAAWVEKKTAVSAAQLTRVMNDPVAHKAIAV